MLTFYSLFIILILVFVGIVLSIYYAWQWKNGLLGWLAFILLIFLMGISEKLVRVAAVIDHIDMQKIDR